MSRGYRLRLIAGLAIPFSIGSTPVPAQPAPASAVSNDSGLTRLLAAEMARFPSQSGIYVKQLGSGEEAAVAADRHFESASTIKLAVMVLAYRLADQKKLDLDKRIEIRMADYRGGSGIFRYNDPGLRPSLRDVVTQMIITSDNSATDLMIAQVGGVAAVNAFLQQSGYRALHLNGTTLDYFRSLLAQTDPSVATLPPEDVFALVTELPAFTAPRQALIERFRQRAAQSHAAAADRPFPPESAWFGVASPRELGRLLEGIERDTAASPAACAEMRRILRAQQAGERKVPHYLSVPVGHKTGETSGVTNDAAIVYAHSGPIIIVAINMAMKLPQAEGDDQIGKLARLVVDYFDGAR